MKKLVWFEKFNESVSMKGQPSYVLDATKIFFSKTTRKFSVEISELGRGFSPLMKGGKEIIAVMNPLNNNMCEYSKSHEERDGENELLYTVYRPISNIGKGTELIVFND